MDLLLEDDAATWAEITPYIADLLGTKAPTSDTVDQFKMLFCQRYPVKILEATPVHLNSEIANHSFFEAAHS